MPCDRNSPKCKMKLNLKTGRLLQPSCCRSLIEELFHSVVDTLESENIPYWIDYGTLLGAVREGYLLEHDDDADFSVWEEDGPRVFEVIGRVAEQNGYHFGKAFRGHGLQLYVSKVNGLHVDLFYWYVDEQIARRRFYVPGTDANKGKDFPVEWVDPLSRIELEGRLVNAPNDPEQMCEWRYGPSWKKPLGVAEFNTSNNPHATEVL